MKKLYEKNELHFSLLWIALYVVLLSLADGVSDSLGISKIVTAPLCVIMAAILYFWIRRNGLQEKYGLCRFRGNPKQYLYFLPLILLILPNVWWGWKLNLTVGETVLYSISMMCVGFLEEIIFRGFLFTAMCRDHVKHAIVVSSITFGLGHIVNLLNGRDIPETLLQICYAAAIGFLFTIIFYRGKSLWPCIITHGAVNSFSILANEDNAPVWGDIAGCIFLCAVSLGYVLYILKKTKETGK
ncbi:MAG: CPBP family intramembrane metalloprotease [Clostridia bacterium]|nr:CPBP family intramembrane metalloprotease [Clostridia bacterium]